MRSGCRFGQGGDRASLDNEDAVSVHRPLDIHRPTVERLDPRPDAGQFSSLRGTEHCLFALHGWHRFLACALSRAHGHYIDRKSTRLNSSHITISYAVFCLKKKKDTQYET